LRTSFSGSTVSLTGSAKPRPCNRPECSRMPSPELWSPSVAQCYPDPQSACVGPAKPETYPGWLWKLSQIVSQLICGPHTPHYLPFYGSWPDLSLALHHKLKALCTTPFKYMTTLSRSIPSSKKERAEWLKQNKDLLMLNL
jgi:hypothetical protein